MAVRLQLVFLSIVIACVIAHVFPQLSAAYLTYDGVRVLEGEIWRLLTCHVCHTNVAHLVMNLVALALLLCLFYEVYSPAVLLAVVAFAGCFIGLAYLLFYPADTQYLGLSGVLHAVASAGAVLSLSKHRLFALVFLLGLTGKLVFENIWGSAVSLSEMINARVAIEAHLMGAVAGAVLSAAILWQRASARPTG